MYREKYLINLFYLLLFTALLNQNIFSKDKREVLEQKLNSAEGKGRIGIIINLMELLSRTNPDDALRYGDDALSLLVKYPNREDQAEVYFLKGWSFHYKNEMDSAAHYAFLTGKISKEAKYERGLVLESYLAGRIQREEGLLDQALTSIKIAEDKNENAKDQRLKVKLINETGSILRRLGRYDEALNHHKQALDLLNDFEDDEELALTLTYMGINNDLKGNYDKALISHQRALEIYKSNNDKRGVAASTHNIGILYQKIDNLGLALEYYQRALSLWEELNNKSNLAATFNSIGAVNELKGNYPEALKYYRQALEIWETIGSKSSISIALNNIGSIHELTGNYREAVNYLTRALAIREAQQDKNGMSASLVILASSYNSMGKTDSAIAAARKGLKYAQEGGSMSSLREAHNVLSNIYETSGMYKEALSEYKKYKEIHDSMFNSESQQAIAEVQEKYRSEEQEQQIEFLRKEKEIETLFRTLLIVGLGLLVLILLLLFNRYRLKRKAHEALRMLHESELESANLRTEAAETKAAMIQTEFDQKKKELETARKLQLSMLPAKLPAYSGVSLSAMMLTATEVGGDYYDFADCEDGGLTVVIGDAAGHGAQAGIVVTAAKSVFNLLYNKNDITEILRGLNSSLRRMHFSSLFMAFGILRLKGNTLQLAGAGMPPAYIYRAASGRVESIPLKGLPLGTVSNYQYQKTSVHLNKDDVVVLLSDGFPELFNSENESYGFERIPALLAEAGKKSVEEIIKHFKSAADEWLNGSRQHDDMTFVVFKMESGQKDLLSMKVEEKVQPKAAADVFSPPVQN